MIVTKKEKQEEKYQPKLVNGKFQKEKRKNGRVEYSEHPTFAIEQRQYNNVRPSQQKVIGDPYDARMWSCFEPCVECTQYFLEDIRFQSNN